MLNIICFILGTAFGVGLVFYVQRRTDDLDEIVSPHKIRKENSTGEWEE